MEQTITYFENTGPENTGTCMELVQSRLKKGDIKAVAVATTSGASALAAAQTLPDEIAVFGINHQPSNRVDPGIREQAEALGAKFIPDEPVVKYLKDIEGHSPDSFRRFGQGMKVAVEVVMQAVEAGFIEAGSLAIGMGGTSKGIDTAAVIKAFGPEQFNEIWVSEILAKPL